MLKKSEKMQIFIFSFNSIKACFVALEQRGVNKKWHFFLVLTNDSNNKEKVWKVQILVSSNAAHH